MKSPFIGNCCFLLSGFALVSYRESSPGKLSEMSVLGCWEVSSYRKLLFLAIGIRCCHFLSGSGARSRVISRRATKSSTRKTSLGTVLNDLQFLEIWLVFFWFFVFLSGMLLSVIGNAVSYRKTNFAVQFTHVMLEFLLSCLCFLLSCIWYSKNNTARSRVYAASSCEERSRRPADLLWSLHMFNASFMSTCLTLKHCHHMCMGLLACLGLKVTEL